jgi:hypothetical protein
MQFCVVFPSGSSKIWLSGPIVFVAGVFPLGHNLSFAVVWILVCLYFFLVLVHSWFDVYLEPHLSVATKLVPCSIF